MRICFFPGGLALGGVGRVALNLATELLNRGYEVDFVLTKRPGELDDQLPSGARVIYLGRRVSSSILALSRYLRRERPDAIWAAREYINVAAIMARTIAGVPTHVIASVHTNESVDALERGGVRRRFIALMARYWYKKADSITAVSAAVADDVAFRLGVSRDKIRVMYNPIYNEQLVALSKAPDRHPVFDDGVPVIIGVGRLTKQKDFGTLIKAFAKVVSNQEAKLLILGDGEDRSQLESLVESLNLVDRVHMPGFVVNPYPLIRQADVFVLSSRWEGFGNVIVEALAVGTEVVSTDCPSGPREILDGGKYGRLGEVANVEDIAELITQALIEVDRSDVLKNRARIFSSSRAVDDLIDMIVTTTADGSVT